MKAIAGVQGGPKSHWVGDGFPVRTLFSYDALGRELSPFLLLDYAGPARFGPTAQRRGVGTHPHRGFETVTIVYQGEVAHRDSTGQGGVIGPGDVQWMTAARGILHQEFHSPGFTTAGGTLQMLQLWVNLPAKHKMSPPGYQAITRAEIPSVDLPRRAGNLRVIAGEVDGHTGPARTFTPINVWDLRLAAGGAVTLDIPQGHNCALVVVNGGITVNGARAAGEADLVLFDRAAGSIAIEAKAEAAILVLTGEPIPEPIAGYGPFVMNTEAEIRQAIDDFNRGSFGHMSD